MHTSHAQKLAIVEYESAGDAKEAVDNMHESEIYGVVIECRLGGSDVKMGIGMEEGAIWENEEFRAKFLDT